RGTRRRAIRARAVLRRGASGRASDLARPSHARRARVLRARESRARPPTGLAVDHRSRLRPNSPGAAVVGLATPLHTPIDLVGVHARDEPLREPYAQALVLEADRGLVVAHADRLGHLHLERERESIEVG